MPKNLRRRFKTSFLRSQSPNIPIRKARRDANRTVESGRLTLEISRMPAPKVTGRLRRNENLTASLLIIPMSRAPNIVRPLLDIPGAIAAAWKIPIDNAPATDRSRILLSPLNLSEMNSATAVTKSIIEVKATSEKRDLISSSSKKPAKIAGIVAVRSSTMYLIDELLFSGLPRPVKIAHKSLNVNNRTAKKVARCKTAKKAAFDSVSSGTLRKLEKIVRCPDEETGRTSVAPCTTPSKR
jgi:hypothetical protein